MSTRPLPIQRFSGRPGRRLAAVAAAFVALAVLATSSTSAALAPPAAAGARPARAGAAPPGDLPVMQPPDLAMRAMLLLVAERRIYEPVTVLEALKRGPELRAELASALGRIPGPQAGSVLAGLLIDDRPEVRRAAAFALGVRGDAAARPALRKAMLDPDRETGALAVEALGRLATPLVEVAEQLLQLPEDERWPRLLPYLFRFKEEGSLALAEHGLGLADPELHRQAAYALARDPLPAAAPLLRRLVADHDPLVRAWAARGLGRVGSGAEDLAALGPLLGDPAAGAVVEALRAGAALVGGGKAPAPDAWRPRLLALLSDPRSGVRVTAIEAAAAWLPDPALAAALAARAGGPQAAPPSASAPGAATSAPGAATSAPGGSASAPAPIAALAAPGSASGGPPATLPALIERGKALVALARGREPRAAALAAAAAGSPEPRLRALAAEAAGLLREEELLGRLASDREALVREAALTARLHPQPAAGAASQATGAGGAGAGDVPARAAAAALSDPDEGVRTAAMDWLAEHPVVPLAGLAAGLTTALHDESIESPLGVIKALAARAEAEPRDRGAIVELLERLGRQPSHALRREAAAGLIRLGRPAPPLGPVPDVNAGGGDELRTYREIVERTRRPRTVEVRTSRGTFRLRLDCPLAPRTCLSFLDLAGQHFYDGMLFHRVVPDFVVQAGDPRGDGYGGPGYVLGDELNRLRYRRGVVGMALAGPDTGGSQFFITLSPQPHLDGGFTAFGEVVAGAEVLDAIEAGDRIQSIVEVR
jgi:cyclophilin family peptidyl-prolyl cis-trans isomerase/HEAT repeat protein